MIEIELTIHSAGNGRYRFFVPSKHSRELFRKRKQKVILYIDNIPYLTHTTCGPLDWDNMKKNQKKGYDLYSSEISKWIIENELHLKNRDVECNQISFTINSRGDTIVLIKK
ncbi:hypothetical protein PQG22_12410 [Aquirufa beregesia]